MIPLFQMNGSDKMIRFIVEKEGLNVRDYLLSEVHLSRQTLKKIKFHGGAIYVNNEVSNVRTPVKKGDVIDCLLPKEERSASLYPVELPLDLVYEDDFILVINKPAHLPVVPTIGNNTPSLAHGLIHYYDQSQLPYTVHIVTRLDQDTSGLVLVAKHQLAHGYFREMKVKRRYLALVEGIFRDKSGILTLPIGRKNGSIIERCVDDFGKYAETDYRVVEEKDNMSLLNIELKTGRTHQIRVHFSHVHHPLIGDTLYGGTKQYANRQALHCYHLAFTHPYTNEALSFTAPWPDDLPGIKVDVSTLAAAPLID
ncbi:RluA family pseudouridine synthase [Halolactibacillus miurensis]|uniref:Pseudouridine synthase n=4 Tax=Halolactibacillus TaxID=306539 RepID=A0A1I6S353_9BACI|nr:RluA family pseudouridine synthase [Halolactibacillus miurensis]SFS71369.1 23S rRNA pseudouridine1911/1915/1917 synthase [Halolactibacillus miurensis]